MPNESLWHRIRAYFRELAADLERNSVSAAGPSNRPCCTTPVEELERQREAYREVVRAKEKPAS